MSDLNVEMESAEISFTVKISCIKDIGDCETLVLAQYAWHMLQTSLGRAFAPL